MAELEKPKNIDKTEEEDKKAKESFLKRFLKPVESILNALKGEKKEIKYLKVRAGTQRFYVKNKEKISYYLKLAKHQAGFLASKGSYNDSPGVVILKTVYKEDK